MTKRTGFPDRRTGDTRTARDLARQNGALQKAYRDACQLIADMHTAAVGEKRQPVRGLVEDVLDARYAAAEEIAHLADLVASLSYERDAAMRRLAQAEAAR